MKKILFATTALVMTAGVASAEITWSGKAEVHIIDTATAAATIGNAVDINLSASTTTDGGLSIGWSNDIGNGCMVDLADKNCDAQSPDLGAGAITLGYAGVTAVLGNDESDDLYDDSQNGDVAISGAAGTITYAIVTDINDQESSWKFGASLDAFALSAAGTTADDNGNGAAKATLTYKMGDTTFSVTGDNKGAAATKTSAKVVQALGDVSVSVAAARQGSTNEWDLGVTYTMGTMKTIVSLDESNNWELDVTYGLGGGATAFLGADNRNTVLAGVNFSF